MRMNVANPMFVRTSAAVYCAVALTAFSGRASAQEAVPRPTVNAPSDQADNSSGSQIADIIVTAERRESSVQKTPIAITALGGDSLKTKQIVDVESLSGRVPNVEFGRNGGGAKVFIRGVGLDGLTVGADSRVAIYTDGIYNARANAAFLGFYDIDRIEVLSGPQGTLYGRNATAGAINIISRDPTKTFEGFGSITVGNYSLVRTEGAVSGPITDTLSARLSFQTADRSGYGENIETGEDADDLRSRAVRGKLLFEPTPALKFLLAADYFNSDDHQGGYHYLDGTPGVVSPAFANGFVAASNRRDVAGPGPRQRLENYGVSLTASYDFGGPNLTSVSGYRKYRYDNESTGDATTSGFVPLFARERAKQFTQELRFADTIGPVDLLIGAYYFHENNDPAIAAPFSSVLFGFPLGSPLTQGVLSGGSQKTRAYAFFTQETIHLTDKLGLDFGLRYSHEKRSESEYQQAGFFDAGFNLIVYDPSKLFKPIAGVTQFLNQSVTYTKTDPKVTLHYQLTDEIMGYATYSQGFQSGGFNIGYRQPAFRPEKLKSYEIGVKADLFDRRLRMNFAAFKYDYKDLQINVIEGIEFFTRNAPAAKIHGVEAQITALPVDDLNVSLNLSWLDSKYAGGFEAANPRLPGQGDVILSNGQPGFVTDGNQLTSAPKYKVNGEIGYTFHPSVGEITPRVNVMWVDRVYFTVFEEKTLSQAPRAEVNLFLDYRSPDKSWSANLFVRNLTNKFYTVSQAIGSQIIGLQKVGQVGAPRTFGLTVTKTF